MRKANKIILTNDGGYNKFPPNTGAHLPAKGALLSGQAISETGLMAIYNSRIMSKLQENQ